MSQNPVDREGRRKRSRWAYSRFMADSDSLLGGIGARVSNGRSWTDGWSVYILMFLQRIPKFQDNAMNYHQMPGLFQCKSLPMTSCLSYSAKGTSSRAGNFPSPPPLSPFPFSSQFPITTISTRLNASRSAFLMPLRTWVPDE